jgi:hypothetical protein
MLLLTHIGEVSYGRLIWNAIVITEEQDLFCQSKTERLTRIFRY